MSNKQHKILFVDDHQLIIDGLKGFISQIPSYQIIGEAHDGNEAIRLAKILEPDLIFMDIEMPGMSGIQASQEIKKERPETKIIIVSMHQEKELIKKLISFQIDGYLLKTSSQQEVLEAAEKVLNGEKCFSDDVKQSLNNSVQASDESNELVQLSGLTEREIEILKCLAEGKTNKEVGETLFISHRTVDTHRTNLMKKLKVNNVAGLIRFAFKNGLVD